MFVAGACLCAALFVSVTAGAKPPPARAVGPMLSAAIAATGTYVGQVHTVDDQVSGKVYMAVHYVCSFVVERV